MAYIGCRVVAAGAINGPNGSLDPPSSQTPFGDELRVLQPRMPRTAWWFDRF